MVLRGAETIKNINNFKGIERRKVIMMVLGMFVAQFGPRECQKARTTDDMARLCKAFDPAMINKYFRRKHLESIGRLRISPDIIYPTEPWLDDNGNIIGIVVAEEREEINGLESVRRRSNKWKFKFNDMIDARTDINQFVSL